MTGPIAERIQQKLTDGLNPDHLIVEDQSERHAGHAGYDPKGETHFHVKVVSQAFDGQNQVTRQRTVYALLSEELKERVHALSLETRTPTEARSL